MKLRIYAECNIYSVLEIYYAMSRPPLSKLSRERKSSPPSTNLWSFKQKYGSIKFACVQTIPFSSSQGVH